MADYRHTVYNIGKQKSASHRNYFVLSEIYAAIRENPAPLTAAMKLTRLPRGQANTLIMDTASFPRMFSARQHFPKSPPLDISATLRQEFAKFQGRFKPGEVG